MAGINLYILVNSQESLDRTLACLTDDLKSVFNDVTLACGVCYDFQKSTDLRVNTDLTLPEAMEAGRIESAIDGNHALFIKSGTEFDPEDMKLFVKECMDSPSGMAMPGTVDGNNGNLEFTYSVYSLFPQPVFQKGERRDLVQEFLWLDGPVIFLSNETMLAVGAFDSMMGDYYAIIDYSVRVRWHQYPVTVYHSRAVTFLNSKPYDSVFTDRATNAFYLSRSNFKRKYGGSVLSILTNT